MRTSVGATVLLLIVGCGGVALGDARSWDQVWRSEAARERISVVGQARTTLAGDGEEISATAAVSAAGGKTRFDYKTRRRQWSLIDDGQSLIELDPRHKEARAFERPRLVTDRALAERNYDARDAGASVIASRPAIGVEIRPKGGGAAVLRLWLDRETGFALKRERYNVDGKLVSSTEYVEVSFGAPVSKELFSLPDGYSIARSARPAEKLNLEQLGERVGFRLRLPGYLPPGYILAGGYQAEWGRREHPRAELRYTDGIRMLSVFERERGAEGAGRERGRHGREGDRGAARHSRGRGEHGRGERSGDGGRYGLGPPTQQVSFVDRGYEKALRWLGPTLAVIAVGDLTQEELLKVARSVERE